MRKRVLIIGSKGMAGHVIRQQLLELPQFEVHDISRDDSYFKSTYQLDVTRFNELLEILQNGKYYYVINCIGVLNQFAERRPDQAILLNSYLPQWLSIQGKKLGFKLIHISTDCVFSGEKGAYTEQDFHDGVGFYAKSKALGEIDNDRDLTIRTSIIGPELKNGIGLFHWFMSQNKAIQGYTKARWSGVTTVELARFIVDSLNKELTGLIHLTNNEAISKYDLLSIINEKFRGEAIRIDPVEGKIVDKSLVNTRNDFTYAVPSYGQMIYDMYEWMKSQPSIYKFYL